MTSHHFRRAIALLVSASLLASLTVASVAVPASAAKPKCQGIKATIVGTKKGEVIRGTAKRDIIVAKGGADRIYGKGGNDIICAGPGNDVVFGGTGADRLWGQLGHDRLFGNAGPDFLAGQVGNDTLVGGIGVDTCHQGPGGGRRVSCERPLPPPVVAPVPPAPPPADGDGDGVPDIHDACPTKGDAGYGVDAKGCPAVAGFLAACARLVGTHVPDHITLVPPYGHIPVPACYWTGISSEDWVAAFVEMEPHCVSLTGGFRSDHLDPDYHVCNPCPPLGCEQ